MKKIAIVHYLPLEYYPPVTNLLNCISDINNIKTYVFSTHNDKGREPYRNAKLSGVFRVSSPKYTEKSIFRLYKYLRFNISVFLKLCWLQPDRILYYESFSVGPVYWYLKIFAKKTKLIVHNHEYVSANWYASGMKLLKIYHKLEQNYLYRKAIIISQTNIDRVGLFLKDNFMVLKEQMMVLPNYPPKSWFKFKKEDLILQDQIRTVYIGTLSLEYCYIKEYCEWIQAQKGKVIFDIYAYNVEIKTHQFLEGLNSSFINYFSGGVEYNEVPKVLARYDVGVILYKALTDNFKYNAPNKIFEYIACGLEVWYSDKMLGIKPYQKNSLPRIIPVNFEELATDVLLDSTKLTVEPHKPFFAEEIYEPFIKKILL